MLRVTRRPDSGKSLSIHLILQRCIMTASACGMMAKHSSRCPCRAALPTYAGLFTLIGSCVALAIELCRGTSPLL